MNEMTVIVDRGRPIMPPAAFGLDLSLSATGIASVNDVGAAAMETIRMPSIPIGSLDNRAPLERIRAICRQVHGWIGLQGPNFIVCMEGLSFGSNDPSAQERAGLHFAMRMSLDDIGIVPAIVAPTQVKKFATGKGNADKALVMMHVFKNWGLTPGNDNEADAFVLAKIGACLLGFSEPTNQAQREVLEAIRAPKAKKPKKRKGTSSNA